MVARAHETLITPQEYLAGERRSDIKHEYDNGWVYAMSGVSRAHNSISVSLTVSLGNQLRGKPCEPMGPDMRVKIGPKRRYVYPDLVVVCEPLQFEDDEFDTLLNPKVIVEILSPSTETFDRGKKFAAYRQLESVTDYVMIAQDQLRVEHYRRQERGDWILHVAEGAGDVVELGNIGCRLALSELYERVSFASEDGVPTD